MGIFFFQIPQFHLTQKTSSKKSSTVRETLAKNSGQFNLKDAQFCQLFPNVVELIRQGKVPKFEPVEKEKAPEFENESDYESVYDASSDSLVYIFKMI